ncbi:MAG: hypothetical protein WBQ68_09735 [Terriglobales bacterium]
MAMSKNAILAAIAVLSITAALTILRLEATGAMAAPRPQGPAASSGFQGAWCAQGDRTKHCSVSGNGVFLTFTNENGDTSTGHFIGMSQNVVSADQWNFVQGTLSGDGQTINWSNGTYWTRCSGGGGHRTPNLDGTWYRSGDRSQRCSIRQRKGNLQLRNESGQSASGSIDRRGRVTTNWSGTQITGKLSPDGNTIYWDNGTSWSR